jgi:hypothetical protein
LPVPPISHLPPLLKNRCRPRIPPPTKNKTSLLSENPRRTRRP